MQHYQGYMPHPKTHLSLMHFSWGDFSQIRTWVRGRVVPLLEQVQGTAATLSSVNLALAKLQAL